MKATLILIIVCGCIGIFTGILLLFDGYSPGKIAAITWPFVAILLALVLYNKED